jgi:hypothetical protein
MNGDFLSTWFLAVSLGKLKENFHGPSHEAFGQKRSKKQDPKRDTLW